MIVRLASVVLLVGLGTVLFGCGVSVLEPEGTPFILGVGPGGEEGKTGGVDGGGGRAIVCRDKDAKILKAEMLDVYEAKFQYGKQVPESSAPFEQQATDALKRWHESVRALAAIRLRSVIDNMKFTPPGTEIKLIDDSFDIIFPKGCAAEQLAHYQNDNLILVSYDIWTKLSETSKAALVLHEAVYAVNRLFGATDSRYSRLYVGKLLAGEGPYADPREGVPKDALNCISSSSPLSFTAYRSGQLWILNFSVLGRKLVVGKTTSLVIIPEIDFNEIKSTKIEKGTDKIGTSVKASASVRSDVTGDDILIFEKKWVPVVDQNGKTVPGYQMLQYWMSWYSGTFPDQKQERMLLTCSLKLNP